MAAHAGTNAHRSWGPLARLRAFASRIELDRRLAAGAAPNGSRELAYRAQTLAGWRTRNAYADGIERVVNEADSPPHPHGAAVPVRREEVQAARADLLRLAAALRAEPGPPVRAIAAASLLLTDGAGPLFSEHPPGTLREAAFQAAFHAEAG
jgi:hypothetical protein